MTATPELVAVLPPPRKRIPGLAGLVAFDPLAPLVAVILPLVMVGSSISWHPGLLALAITVPLLVLAQPRRGSLFAVAVVALSVAITYGLGSSVPASGTGGASWHTLFLTQQQVHAGAGLGVRIGGLLALILLAGLLSDPSDMLRSAVAHLGLPLRVAQAGITALSFTAVLRREHRAILEAHLLRGSQLDLPFLGPVLRWTRSAPTLVAAAVRHAERVSMSMDARAFGAHPRRTERRVFTWRLRDTTLVLAGVALAAGLFLIARESGFAFFPTRS